MSEFHLYVLEGHGRDVAEVDLDHGLDNHCPVGVAAGLVVLGTFGPLLEKKRLEGGNAFV